MLGWLLLRWRRGKPAPVILGRYLVFAGVLRFAIEFLRVNERVALGLSVAHLVSIAVVILGAGMLIAARNRTPAS